MMRLVPFLERSEDETSSKPRLTKGGGLNRKENKQNFYIISLSCRGSNFFLYFYLKSQNV